MGSGRLPQACLGTSHTRVLYYIVLSYFFFKGEKLKWDVVKGSCKHPTEGTGLVIHPPSEAVIGRP